jgi:hypothetical protein
MCKAECAVCGMIVRVSKLEVSCAALIIHHMGDGSHHVDIVPERPDEDDELVSQKIRDSLG